MPQITQDSIIKMVNRFEHKRFIVWEANPNIILWLEKFKRRPSWQKWLLRRWYSILDLYDKVRGLCHK